MSRNAIYKTDPVLTQVAIQYRNRSLVAPDLFPNVTVPEDEGRWFKYDPANNMTDTDNDEIATNSRSSSIEDEYNLTTESYGPIPKRSRKILVLDDDVKLAPNPLSPRQDATEVVNDRYDLRREIKVASVMATAGNFGATVTKSGTGQWSDYDNSDPLGDIETGVESVLRKTGGLDPDTMVFPFQVWRKLRRHPGLVGLFTNVAGGLLTQAQFLELLNEYGIAKLIIAKPMRNTAKEGQTASLDYIWGKHAWILRTGAGAELRQKDITYGRNLVVDKFQRVVDTWRENDPDGEWIRVSGKEKDWVMAKDAGYAIFNAIA